MMGDSNRKRASEVDFFGASGLFTLDGPGAVQEPPLRLADVIYALYPDVDHTRDKDEFVARFGDFGVDQIKGIVGRLDFTEDLFEIEKFPLVKAFPAVEEIILNCPNLLFLAVTTGKFDIFKVILDKFISIERDSARRLKRVLAKANRHKNRIDSKVVPGARKLKKVHFNVPGEDSALNNDMEDIVTIRTSTADAYSALHDSTLWVRLGSEEPVNDTTGYQNLADDTAQTDSIHSRLKIRNIPESKSTDVNFKISLGKMNRNNETLTTFILMQAEQHPEHSNTTTGNDYVYFDMLNYLFQEFPHLATMSICQDSLLNHRNTIYMVINAVAAKRHYSKFFVPNDDNDVNPPPFKMPEKALISDLLVGMAKRGANLDYKERHRNSLMYLSIAKNVPVVLECLLEMYLEKGGQALVNSKLQDLDEQDFYPLTSACAGGFVVDGDSSRMECVRLLIEKGKANVNMKRPANIPPNGDIFEDMTPLLACFVFEDIILPHQEEVALYLLDHKADYTAKLDNRIQVIGYAIMCHALRAVEKIIDMGLDLEMKIGPNGAFGLPIVRACSDYLFDRTQDLPNKRDLRMIQLLHERGSSLKEAWAFMVYPDSKKQGREIFKYLVNVSDEINKPRPNRRTVLMENSGNLTDLCFFKELIAHGADPHLRFTPYVCKNDPPHEVACVNSMSEFEQLKDIPPGTSRFFCSYCLNEQEPSTQLVGCTGNLLSCTFNLCKRCLFFSGGSKGMLAKDIPRRYGDPVMVNWTAFVSDSAVAKKLIDMKAFEALELFKDANLSDARLCQKLTYEKLRNLGFSEDLLDMNIPLEFQLA